MKQNLIVMGIAPCLEGDLEQLFRLAGPDAFDFMAVGLDCAERYLGRIEHAVSYHPDEFGAFRKRREAAGGNLDYRTHAHKHAQGVDHIWPYEAPSGSSAMLGVEAGLGLGYGRIVVAGVPLDTRYHGYRGGWDRRIEKLRDRVRGMSGYPRELLGEPTAEWLNGKG